MNPGKQNMLLSSALLLVYFAAGKFGLYFFGLIHPSASAIWLPTGISIAALLLFGYRLWPAIFGGAFLVNVSTAGSLASSLGMAMGNTLEAVIATYLVNRFAGGRHAFVRPTDILTFAFLAALVSTTVSATIGVTSLTLGGHAPHAEFAAIWFTWWLGDAAGAMLVTPLLVLWYTDRDWNWKPAKILEVVLLLATTGIVAGVTFFHPALARYPLAFLCLAPLVWAALRFGPREVATVVALLSAIATAATVTGHGSFVLPTPNESLLALQAFMALTALTALPMAALTVERSALLERERAAREKADAASRAKDEFLAILSHELRNPLSAISAAAAVLEKNDKTQNADWLPWVSIIERQTRHLARLIDDLLDIGRVTVNKMSLRREPLELGDVAQRCVQGLTSTGVLTPGRVRLQIQPVWIDADPDRIEQIISNLIGNAIKHTPAERDIRVVVASEGTQALLRVEDEGAGIRAELLPRVFDPFTQGEQGLERATGGLGIGLTLVRRLTELHGGTVEAHSQGTGCGSAFVVRLPRSAAPDPAGAEQSREPPRSCCRLLVVEDNADARHALRALLEAVGYEVHEAADGESGVAAALKLAPDVVLVDIGLPRLDGYEVARRLKAANPDIRVVAVTGYGRDDDMQRSSQAGFDAHLLKPVSIDRLRAVIEKPSRRPHVPASAHAAHGSRKPAEQQR
jgi:signal transduction histidine kinase/ActR/RegA family two-component response regulator